MLPVLQQQFDALEQSRREFWGLIAQASTEQRHFKPSPDAWCMLQVAQHIISAEDSTLRFAQKYTAIKLGFWDNIKNKCNAFALKFFLATPFKFKAPKIDGLNPKTAEPYETVENRWATVRESWRLYLDDVTTDQLDKVIFKHPVGGKLTLPQTLDNFMLAHLQHHLQQLKRIAQSPNFPK